MVVRRVTWLLLSLLAARAAAQERDEPAHDGKWLYSRNCSGCHNDNGDGRGVTILQLGLTARDFKQGGFAFGDTREQMMRTVSTGIPGRSPMPSFKGVLSDEEIGLVVDYVRASLMPPRKDDAPKNTIMLVRDKPVIARGKLPPLVDGGADIPRGLLIGTPEGMTFEYDLDGVKLLAVRLGAFADREDWHDRGGEYLKPLGEPMWFGGNDSNSFLVGAHLCEYQPIGKLRHILGNTWSREGKFGLTFSVRDHDGSGPQLLWCSEALSTTLLSTGLAFTRDWSLAIASDFDPVLRITGSAGSTWVAAADTGGDATNCYWRQRPDRSVEVVLVRATPALEIQASGCLDVHSAQALETSGMRIRATFVVVPAWTPELGEKLAKELGH